MRKRAIMTSIATMTQARSLPSPPARNRLRVFDHPTSARPRCVRTTLRSGLPAAMPPHLARSATSPRWSAGSNGLRNMASTTPCGGITTWPSAGRATDAPRRTPSVATMHLPALSHSGAQRGRASSGPPHWLAGCRRGPMTPSCWWHFQPHVLWPTACLRAMRRCDLFGRERPTTAPRCASSSLPCRRRSRSKPAERLSRASLSLSDVSILSFEHGRACRCGSLMPFPFSTRPDLAFDMRQVIVNQRCIPVSQAREFFLNVLERIVRHFVKIDKAGTRAFHATQQFIELERHDPRFAVLGVLDQKHHQEGDNGRAGVDDELPSIRVAEVRAGEAPDNDGDDRKQERPIASSSMRGFLSKSAKRFFHR